MRRGCAFTNAVSHAGTILDRITRYSSKSDLPQHKRNVRRCIHFVSLGIELGFANVLWIILSIIAKPSQFSAYKIAIVQCVPLVHLRDILVGMLDRLPLESSRIMF